MSQSLAQIYLHVVFSTKDRKPFLTDKGLRDRTHSYLAGICKNLDCPALIVGGVEDHAHMLCRLGKTIEVGTLLRELKRDSSKWIKTEQPRLAEFHWQAGYGAFSISPAHVDPLTEYISNQEQHHHRESFKDEFRKLCKNMVLRSMNGTFGTEWPAGSRLVWINRGTTNSVEPLRGSRNEIAK